MEIDLEKGYVTPEEYAYSLFEQFEASLAPWCQFLLQQDEVVGLETDEVLKAQKFSWLRSLWKLLRSVHDEGFLEDQGEAGVIIGYVSLRSVAEYFLKIFILVHEGEYEATNWKFKNSDGSFIPVHSLTFEQLKQAFRKIAGCQHEEILTRIQQRGNAIHSYKAREIGLFTDLSPDIVNFVEFADNVMAAVNSTLSG